MPEQLNFKAQSLLDKFVAGVDEVGRGSLFGDVVAAAVVLDVKKPINGLADDKLLRIASAMDVSKIPIEDKILGSILSDIPPKLVEKIAIVKG